jgi:predicted nuclease of predicted toxin-antitoxin system
MRFLVDAQLPPALARLLEDRGHQAEHVLDCGLERASDAAIWARAVANGASIISKDEDFAVRRVMQKAGPAVVWIRLGNTSKRQMLHWLDTMLPSILAALERGDTLIELT